MEEKFLTFDGVSRETRFRCLSLLVPTPSGVLPQRVEMICWRGVSQNKSEHLIRDFFICGLTSS